MVGKGRVGEGGMKEELCVCVGRGGGGDNSDIGRGNYISIPSVTN